MGTWAFFEEWAGFLRDKKELFTVGDGVGLLEELFFEV